MYSLKQQAFAIADDCMADWEKHAQVSLILAALGSTAAAGWHCVWETSYQKG